MYEPSAVTRVTWSPRQATTTSPSRGSTAGCTAPNQPRAIAVSRVSTSARSPSTSWAREQKAVAVVVDALRASATITVLLQQGASEVVVVKEVDEAYAYRQAHRGMLYAARAELIAARLQSSGTHGSDPGRSCSSVSDR